MLTQTGLGERIARARRELHLSQERLAASIGLDRSALSRAESGARAVDSLELTRISEATGRPVTWFLADEEQPLDVLLRAQGAESTDVRGELDWLADFVRDYRFLRSLPKDPGQTARLRAA